MFFGALVYSQTLLRSHLRLSIHQLFRQLLLQIEYARKNKSMKTNLILTQKQKGCPIMLTQAI